MTDYKEIKGFNIEELASDPPAPFEGQVWYNTTDDQLKVYSSYPTGAWAVGANLIHYRTSLKCVGTQTAALTVGGLDTRGPQWGAQITESYNGTAWTEVNQLNKGRDGMGAFGTQTAAIGTGGRGGFSGNPFPDLNDALVESWNGSSWSEVADLSSARFRGGGAGTSTAGINFGGQPNPYTSSPVALNESWNGSSWTEVGDLNAIFTGTGWGTQTAAIAMRNATTGIVESWNGSAWTVEADPNQYTGIGSVAKGGTSTDGLVYGGPANGFSTESWNGSAWTSLANSNFNSTQAGGAGTSSSALKAGGNSSPLTMVQSGAQTEEWVAPVNVNRVVQNKPN